MTRTHALLLFGVLAASACALNPQPIPPEDGEQATGDDDGTSGGLGPPRSPNDAGVGGGSSGGGSSGSESSSSGSPAMDGGIEIDGGPDAGEPDAGEPDAGAPDAG